MKEIFKADKLRGVFYDIRGPVLDLAKQLEDEGQRILKLNVGNPAPFGFNAPDEIMQDVIANVRNAEGYTDSKGLYSARKAIMQECQYLDIEGVNIDDIYLGNGVSELIVLSMQALLNAGDEVLIPAPDYPLWTAAVTLSSGKPVHYICDEAADWFPDLEDMESKVTANTRAMVIINPNNPTGAVYSEVLLKEMVALATKYDLIIFADEIYSKILYDDAVYIPVGRLAKDVLCISFNGLSKSYRLAGFRSGWMVVSGNKKAAKNYIEGLDMLATMRLCANVPAMYAVQTALGGRQSIKDLVLPGGRLLEQRDVAYEMINSIPGLSCTKPKGALYCFPKIDKKKFKITNDELWVMEYLRQKQVLVVQGTGFNWSDVDHFRIVFLPRVDDLREAILKLGDFLDTYQQA
ncbi:MAG: alanine-synthesizing transaminase [Saprospiraceae bacterium]|jgi:alanine-synthesizing transaminase